MKIPYIALKLVSIVGRQLTSFDWQFCVSSTTSSGWYFTNSSHATNYIYDCIGILLIMYDCWCKFSVL